MKNATACQRRLRFLVDSPYAASLFGFIGPQASGCILRNLLHGSATGGFRLQETVVSRVIHSICRASSPAHKRPVLLLPKPGQYSQSDCSRASNMYLNLLSRRITSSTVIPSVLFIPFHVYKRFKFLFFPSGSPVPKADVFLPAGLTAGPGKEDAENTLAV